MASTLEGAALDLIKDKNVATMSTLRKDGTIQSVVVWADADGTMAAVTTVTTAATQATHRAYEMHGCQTGELQMKRMLRTKRMGRFSRSLVDRHVEAIVVR